MPKYARVINGEVVETRNFSAGEIPAHKQYLWTPIIDEIPSIDTTYEYLTGPEEVITANAVTRTWTAHTYDINELKQEKIDEVWNYMVDLLETTVTANVWISEANSYYEFGCDRESRENILGINTAINSGLPIPNPRPWTPKGALVSANCNHTDLLNIGGGLLAAKDAHMQTYFSHKYNISMEAAANNHANIAYYEYTQGWPE